MRYYRRLVSSNDYTKDFIYKADEYNIVINDVGKEVGRYDWSADLWKDVTSLVQDVKCSRIEASYLCNHDLLRVGNTTNNFTRGKIYEVRGNGYIVDDSGTNQSYLDNRLWKYIYHTDLTVPKNEEKKDTFTHTEGGEEEEDYTLPPIDKTYEYRWVEGSGGFWTKGKTYLYNPLEEKISTNSGSMTSCDITSSSWEAVEYTDDKIEDEEEDFDLSKCIDYVTYDNSNFISHFIRKNNLTETKEETKMKELNITKPTLINGTDADNMSVDQLIQLIEQEKASVARLQALDITSKTVVKLEKKHNSNINELIKLIDSK